MTVIDISRELSPATAVWPGDRPVDWSWTTRIDDGSSVNVGAVCTSTHAATHVDAPLHFRREGRPVGDVDLGVFVGPAQVVDATGADVIGPDAVDGVDAERVLFKTAGSQISDTSWSDSFPVIDPATVERLGERSVVLIGIDTPSVDPPDSTQLPAHHALADAGIVNLENLQLRDVAPGTYRLLALPLKLQGADAAPVRAVLEPAETRR